MHPPLRSAILCIRVWEVPDPGPETGNVQESGLPQRVCLRWRGPGESQGPEGAFLRQCRWLLGGRRRRSRLRLHGRSCGRRRCRRSLRGSLRHHNVAAGDSGCCALRSTGCVAGVHGERCGAVYSASCGFSRKRSSISFETDQRFHSSRSDRSEATLACLILG